MMESFDLVDIWRDQHPNLMQFTWRSYNPPVQSRLDFFLISFNLYAQIDKSEISSGFKTDHSLVKFHVVPVHEGVSGNLTLLFFMSLSMLIRLRSVFLM